MPYFPQHLTHLMLASHIADETGTVAGAYKQHKSLNHGRVIFSSKTNEHNYGISTAPGYVDMTAHLKDWRVEAVSDDVETGYCGIIYINENAKQIVLAHRSTNFALGLTTENVIKGSGVQQDVSVFTNHVSLHQAKAYEHTKKAVEMVQKTPKFHEYALSFTGHSLGAWLAAMSAFYCVHGDLNHPFVQAVIVDGPGSRNMMEHIQSKSMKPFLDPSSLPVIEYVNSPPNIVNTAGQHVGQVFALKAIPDQDIPGAMQVGLGMLKVVQGGATVKAVAATVGHDLKHILPEFDPTTGLPRKFAEVDSWPSTKYMGAHPDNSCWTRVKGCFSRVLCCSGDDADEDGATSNTFSSMSGFLLALIKGEIDQSDLDSVFTTRKGEDGAFEKKYDGNLRLLKFNPQLRAAVDIVDKILVELKKNTTSIMQKVTETVRSSIEQLLLKYEVSELGNKLQASNDNTVADIRDQLVELLHRHKLTEVFGMPQFPPKPVRDITEFALNPGFVLEEKAALLGDGNHEPTAEAAVAT